MADTINLGIVGIKNVGEYNSQTIYEKLNVVTYQGSSYCAIKNSQGNLPTNTDYWQLYAEKGEKGDTGEEGPKPIKGVDYYTADDIEAIENDLSDTIADEISEQLGNLVSATPLAATSVLDMTDTTRIYVNTTDGHWYYYDGTTWNDGGVYQATEDSETVNELSEITYDIVNVKTDYLKNIEWTEGQISTTDGKTIVQSSTKYHTPLFEIQQKKYIFNKTVDRLFLYDNNEDMLLYTGNVSEYNVTNSNAKYMRVVASTADYQTMTMFEENAKNEVKLSALPIDEIENAVNNKIVATIGMFNSVGALGDSYTAGAVLKEDGVTWVNMPNQTYIATMAKRAGTNFINFGHGGASTRSYINEGFLQDVINADAQNMYFMCFGFNDASKLGPTYLGTISDINDNDYTQNADTFYGNYGKIIQRVREHAPKSKQTLFLLPKKGSNYIPFVEAIKNIANHFNIPYIDPYDDDYFDSDLYNNTFSSGHPTAVSYVGMGLAYERLFSKCVENHISYFNHSNE